MYKDKVYLGDGVYVEYDGWQLRLWTFNGMRDVGCEVFLEPDVMYNLMDFYKKATTKPSAEKGEAFRHIINCASISGATCDCGAVEPVTR